MLVSSNDLTEIVDEMQRFSNLPHNLHDKTHLLAGMLKQIVQDHLNYQRSGERPHYGFEYWERILYLTGALEPKTVWSQQKSEDGESIGSSQASTSNRKTRGSVPRE